MFYISTDILKLVQKEFVTRVGLAGRYEVFKLDGYSLEVPTAAYGGASRIEWEELLERLEDDIAKSILEKDVECRDNVDVQIVGVSKL